MKVTHYLLKGKKYYLYLDRPNITLDTAMRGKVQITVAPAPMPCPRWPRFINSSETQIEIVKRYIKIYQMSTLSPNNYTNTFYTFTIKYCD